MTGKQSQRVS